MLQFVIGYCVCAYVADVVLRPIVVSQRARRAARARGKRLLNVGSGTAGTSLRVALFGPTDWGDVNCDLGEKGAWDGRRRRCACDVHRLPFRDREFGAVIASHVLEHVDDPAQALRELHRVADRVYVVTPRWWAPHTWFYDDHQWYRRDDGRWVRLRRRRRARPKRHGCGCRTRTCRCPTPRRSRRRRHHRPTKRA